MRRVLAAEPAELAHLEPLGRLLLVLRRAVVAPLALAGTQRDDVSHESLSAQAWLRLRASAPVSLKPEPEPEPIRRSR